MTGLMVGSVAGVTLDQLDREAVRTAHAAAVATERAHDERIATAATERLSGQATLYFARRRTEALEAAQVAVTEAGLLRASVSAVVGEDALGPLDDATTALTALVGVVPTAPTVLQDATATVAAAVPVPAPTVVPVAPTTPGADVLSLVAEVKLSLGTDADRTASPAGPGGARPGADVGLAPVAVSSPASEPPVASVPIAPVEAVPASAGPSLETSAPPAAALADAAAGGLDVNISNQILGLVDEIRAVSVEVRATADAVVAAQQAAKAAAEAAAEAQAAADRAARTMRNRVAATIAAPNGEIPTDLLCGVTFAPAALLRCDAAPMLEQMNAAYRQATGRHLVISSSYRTTAEQEVLRAAKGELAAQAGKSNHGRALAIDVAGAGAVGQFDAPIYQWLVANAGTYGWHHPAYMEPGGGGPLEPWHWEYDTD